MDAKMGILYKEKWVLHQRTMQQVTIQVIMLHVTRKIRITVQRGVMLKQSTINKCFDKDSVEEILKSFAAGAVGGTIAITELIPVQYRHMLGGPYLKVDLHTGAIAEGVLTFIISFIVLFIILRGPNNVLLKTWLLAVSTVALIVAGSDYTGPSMNPANAFGWAYVNNRHNTWEQLYVYWVCPFVGAVLAAWTFRFIFPPVKQKKA